MLNPVSGRPESEGAAAQARRRLYNERLEAENSCEQGIVGSFFCPALTQVRHSKKNPL